MGWLFPGARVIALEGNFDQALEIANKRGVRLIMPFIDQASWWGGIEEFAAFRGKSKNDFYTDPQVKADFKKLVEMMVDSDLALLSQETATAIAGD